MVLIILISSLHYIAIGNLNFLKVFKGREAKPTLSMEQGQAILDQRREEHCCMMTEYCTVLCPDDPQPGTDCEQIKKECTYRFGEKFWEDYPTAPHPACREHDFSERIYACADNERKAWPER